MILENKLGITNQIELHKEEERISKLAAKRMYDSGLIDKVEINQLLKHALTGEINERKIFTKGIDVSYFYEGYDNFRTEEL